MSCKTAKLQVEVRLSCDLYSYRETELKAANPSPHTHKKQSVDLHTRSLASTHHVPRIIVVGYKVKKAKIIAIYCKRVEKISADDNKFMKDKKPIFLFGQGQKNDICADCKCFIKKRTHHNRSRPKASLPSDAVTTAATSGVAVVTPVARIEVV